jgi:hypothetical protein
LKVLFGNYNVLLHLSSQLHIENISSFPAGEDFMESAGLFEEPPAPIGEVTMPDPAVSMVEEPSEKPGKKLVS